MNTICQVCETNTQEHDTNDPHYQIISLGHCRSEDDWNQACDRIKASRGGQYPKDWWVRVMLSGLMARVVKNFR